MSVQMIRERLEGYQCRTALEEDHALREITQEVVLAALGRGDFFTHALFQGGTCLRIFHGLSRFSEDLDFMLRAPDPAFRLGGHLTHLADELAAYGYHAEITDRSQAGKAVQTAFVKDDSIGKLIEIRHPERSGPLRKIRIKLEVDTNPPAGSGAVLDYLDFPFVASVSSQDMPSLFAGKVYALLCRAFMKGRDWYDFLWYTSRAAPLNLTFLSSALDQAGPWKGMRVDAGLDWVSEELSRKIRSIDWQSAAAEVAPFIRAHEQASLRLWSEDLFLHQLNKWQKARDTGA
ncbi:MAG: nucleotidyl transferase AbiEii/AbiGii toxin family protein [Candidatus Hydrogenedens sp.]|nr:nucleotidyl transferase AbiEii/AbiGii toxin family protein [Candidatus Hydrogenedens sp.]